YHRLRRLLYAPEDLLTADRALFGLQRSLRRELADVRTRNEGASSAGEDHAADVLSLAHLVDRLAELTDRGGVQGVELVGAIHRDPGATVGDGHRDRSVWHSRNWASGDGREAPRRSRRRNSNVKT